MERFLSRLALILLIIGGLNWGLIGFFNWNLVGSLLGEASFLTRTIYILVGISSIWMIIDFFGQRRHETKRS